MNNADRVLAVLMDLEEVFRDLDTRGEDAPFGDRPVLHVDTQRNRIFLQHQDDPTAGVEIRVVQLMVGDLS